MKALNWICFCFFFIALIVALSLGDRRKDYEEITVLANSSVYLPCNPASEGEGAGAVIVLWYKSTNPEPFYSYDLRQPLSDRHWSDDTVFGRRAHFESRRPVLSITSARPQDEGVYRCRVDFERGPSKTNSIKLNVIILPSFPFITDETGVIVTKEAGPYFEGDTVVLTCKSIGGRPPPSLVWMRNGNVVEDSFNGDPRGQVRNLLHLENLGRDYLGANFTCRATNTNITEPLDTSIRIDMTLAPMSVSLKRLNGAQEFVINSQIERLECLTFGGHPQPQITWWRDGENFSDPKIENDIKNNVTKSILRFTPKPADLGVIITCRVENVLMPNAVLEESYKLNVHYIPIVNLKMGLGLDPRSIKEGADIFMECTTNANPKISNLQWMHEGKEIKQNLVNGVIISNRSLVLQSVTKERSGTYRCVAQNSIGRGYSRPIHLVVMYPPLCKPGMKTTYQIPRHVTANITCNVEAQPKNVSFRWQFNSSGGITDVKGTHVNTKGQTSYATYTPTSPADYGLLLCMAENAIGGLKEPCIFNITVAKLPELLERCEIGNQSSHSVYVTCKSVPTELPTAFTMEVHTSDDLALVTTVRNNTPAFVASGLNPGTAYVLHIGVKTPMGVSEPIKLRAFTVRTAEKRMGITEKGNEETTILLPVICGLLVSLFLIISVALVVAIKTCSRRRRNPPSTRESKSPAMTEVASFADSQKEVLNEDSNRCSMGSGDKHLFDIPLTKDCDYQLEELRVPSDPKLRHSAHHLSHIRGANMPPCFSLSSKTTLRSSSNKQDSNYVIQSSNCLQNQHQRYCSSESQHQPLLVPTIQKSSLQLSKVPIGAFQDSQHLYQENQNLPTAPSCLPPVGFRCESDEHIDQNTDDSEHGNSHESPV